MPLFILLVLLINGGECIPTETFNKYLIESTNSSEECLVQKEAFLDGLRNNDDWALRMLDSYGRIPQAIAQGNRVDLGTMGQCLNLYQKLENVTIKGRYCLFGLIIPMMDITNATSRAHRLQENGTVAIRPNSAVIGGITGLGDLPVLLISACVPDSCVASDFFGQLGLDVMCVTNDENEYLTPGNVAYTLFVLMVVLLVVGSTAYDLYIQRRSKEPRHPILLAFSLSTNGRKILRTNRQSGQILFFNGLKAISMFWVIMGHTYEALAQIISNNDDVEEWKRKWYVVYVFMSPLAVDTFFFVSGALLAFTFLKSMKKPTRKFNLLLYYVHRYLRLTPALAALYFFQITVNRALSLVPESVNTLTKSCKEHWWSFFLYIQNYVNPTDLCLNHTWYLSVDMQLFIISPAILFPLLWYRKKMVYIGLPVLMLAATATSILVHYLGDLANDYKAATKWDYSTQAKLTQWFAGILFGAFILDHQKNKARYRIKSKAVVVAMWALVFVVIGVVFYFNDDVTYNPGRVKVAFYNPLQKLAWSLSLWWISFACLNGDGGYINSFLSIPSFQIISKITYSTYLVHFLVVEQLVLQARSLFYFLEYAMIRETIAHIVISCLLRAVWALLFEYPMIAIEQVVFGTGKKKKVEEAKESCRKGGDVAVVESGDDQK